MTLVSLKKGNVQYIPLIYNIPNLDIAFKIKEWQQKYTPGAILAVLSNDHNKSGFSMNYNDYDWSKIL